MSKNDKIFCMDCPFYYKREKHELCLAYDNMIDTHRAPKCKPVKSPKDINKNNDCEWFETQESFLERTMELKEELTRWERFKRWAKCE